MNFRITRLAIAAMTVLCAGMCAAGPRLTAFVMQRPTPMINGPVRFWMILIAGYALAALAFLCLFSLYRLICRIEQGDIFTMANVKGLRAIGDGASVTRGLQQASANGLSVARSILKSMK